MSKDDTPTSESLHRMRQCLDDACGFRYPAPADPEMGASCPMCQAPTSYASRSYAGHQHRSSADQAGGKGPHIEVLLDNLRSSYNVGSIFRTCDGAGVCHVHMCGITSTPNQRKVAKTALGADGSVAWTYHRNGLRAVRDHKENGFEIWSLERGSRSTSIFDCSASDLVSPVLLVVGNELSGIDPGILDESDRIVSLPMLGRKSSLNAVVAFGVAAYWLRFGIAPA